MKYGCKGAIQTGNEVLMGIITDLGYFKYCSGNKNDNPGACETRMLRKNRIRTLL